MFYQFGKAFNYNLYAGLNGELLAGLPSNQESNCKLYVFTTRPDRAAALAGTGAIVGPITGTVQNYSPGTKTYIQYPVTAIPDPDSTSETKKYDYWISATYIKQASGAKEIVVRELPIMRAYAHDAVIGVTNTTIIDGFKDVTAYLTTAQIDSVILLAERYVRDDIAADQLEFARVQYPEELFWLVYHRTMSMIAQSQYLKPGDKFDQQKKEADSGYAAAKNRLKLSYDLAGLGGETGRQQVAKSYILGTV